MGRFDDESILPDWTLARGVRAGWIEVDENGNEEVQSRAFDESNQEISCFLLEEVGGLDGFCGQILPIIENELGSKLRVAIIQVAAARGCGFWIYRKPEEFHGNSAHVVLCPQQIDNISHSQFKKRARDAAKRATLQPL